MGLLAFTGCEETEASRSDAPPPQRLFTLLSETYTLVDFRNDLAYTEAFNPYTFRNFYNGGGVGIGDVNRDGLMDVYLCGNQVDNRLYLNRGDFEFTDITEEAGVACEGVWSSGVSMADVNGDGWLDIYICKSGSPDGNNRYNELFINDGNPDEEGLVTFTEQAEAWGLGDLGLSTHAAFFDYDRDGDLDCYLLNNSLRSVGGYDLIKDQREIPDSLGGNRLYRHDGDHYTNVSQEAGIYSSAIGFGLGVTIGDIDRDGWLDIYVSNDFFERDYLYLNQRDGTFAEVLTEQLPEISLSSMGADLADLNHDGYPEIFVTDMLPESDARMKTKTMFENWDKYQLNLRQGYHRQFTRNMLQLNHGDGSFSDIGRLAGVYATDWSWGALMFDFDNDGHRDIFVANGIYKDLTDQDYINFFASPQTVRRILKRENAVIAQLVDSIPSTPLPNYAFRQIPNPSDPYLPAFENQADEMGLGQPGFSNGSAYADLDNDGDLDLVINQVNQPASIYRNNSDTLRPDHHWLGIQLTGEKNNQFALGSRATLIADGQLFYQELAPMRGFQSCVDPRLLIGLGGIERVDTLLVQWPDGSYTLQTDIPVDQYLTLSQRDQPALEEVVMQIKKRPASVPAEDDAATPPLAQPVPTTPIAHQENDFQDFRRDPLLFHMRSTEGPPMCQADFNGDGRMDYYLGGAKQQAGRLFVQAADGSFRAQAVPAFEQDAVSEDTDCACFDANGDGRPDLYVASGGNEFAPTSSALLDRLYINLGSSRFESAPEAIASVGKRSTGAVQAADVDGDGDQDLFVGTRLRPFLFGIPVDGLLLQNDGRGNFSDITDTHAPGLRELGLITDARWGDFDGDRDLDLVVAGEWMPIAVFLNERGRLVRQSETLANSHGWWHSLAVFDVDQDGDLDIAAGNWGENTRFRVSVEQPARMYVNDFDGNGRAEQLITMYEGDAAYPVALLPDVVKQMPALRRKYLKHVNYQGQTIEDMFPAELIDKSVIHQVSQGASSLLINDGDGQFDLRPLPKAAQLAPVYAMLPQDVDGDGAIDLLLGGNLQAAKPEVGIYAGSYGLVLKGDGRGGFTPQWPRQTGLKWTGDVRDLMWIQTVRGPLLLVARNNDRPLGFLWNTSRKHL